MTGDSKRFYFVFYRETFWARKIKENEWVAMKQMKISQEVNQGEFAPADI